MNNLPVQNLISSPGFVKWSLKNKTVVVSQFKWGSSPGKIQSLQLLLQSSPLPGQSPQLYVLFLCSTETYGDGGRMFQWVFSVDPTWDSALTQVWCVFIFVTLEYFQISPHWQTDFKLLSQTKHRNLKLGVKQKYFPYRCHFNGDLEIYDCFYILQTNIID